MSLKDLDSKFVLHTYARREIDFVRGVNSTLFDDKGDDYIDFTSGIGVVSVGHGNERLASTIADQAKNIIHISNLYLIRPQAELAKRVVELSGIDARCFFANSGAEANEGAIKIARKYGEEHGESKRYKIITLQNSFHGRTITALKATGQEKMHNYFGPYPDGFAYASSVDQIVSMLDDHTVAVMLELVQGEGGVSPLDKEQVQKLAKLLKERDILLIVDEIQTGVFRTGELLASTLYEITPDIITLAKGLAGGVPIGAILTTHKDIFAAGDHGSTFGGNYLSTASALTTLEILEEYKTSGKLDEMISYFRSKCESFVADHSHLFEGETGLGLMRAFIAKDDKIQQAVIDHAHKNRVLVLKSGRNRVRMLPPLLIGKDEIDEGFARLKKACADI